MGHATLGKVARQIKQSVVKSIKYDYETIQEYSDHIIKVEIMNARVLWLLGQCLDFLF